jgi:hypothetical protein
LKKAAARYFRLLAEGRVEEVQRLAVSDGKVGLQMGKSVQRRRKHASAHHKRG